MEAENIYENTMGKVSPTDSIVLHHSPIDEIIKWSQEHLDANLALDDIIIVQLGCIAVCNVGWESYGFDRCSVLVITGVLKFLLTVR
jgi:hypothetical protein